MKIEDLEKALQYFTIAVPENEEQAKAYFWARKALTALRSMLEAGEPLSLEQLKQMDGKPVFIPEINCWALITKDVFVMLFTFPDGEKCSANDWYQSVGPVYAYPPAHIDRSEWKPCVDCRIKCRTCVVRGKEKCARCEKYSEYVPENNFCSNCGRPLTEEAWAELERRLRG